MARAEDTTAGISTPRQTAPQHRKGLPAALAVLAAYAAIAVWWLWPLPVMWSDHAIYPGGVMPEVAADFHLNTWTLAWDTHALLSDPGRLFDANIFFPAPRALAFSEHLLGYLPLFAPTFLLTGNAVLASNVLIFLTYPLCAIAAFALARRFVSEPAAAVAGLLFAFWGSRYSNFYHLQQLGSFYLPLALLFTERWLERARVADAVALAACVALQLLSSFYLGYALLALYAVYLPLALWRWRPALDRRRAIGLVVALGGAALPFLLSSLPYLELQRLGLIPSARGQEVADLYSMDPRVTMLQVRRYLTQNGLWPIGYALALLGLLVGWRANGYPRLLGLVVVATGLVLACGPRIDLGRVDLWSPYALAVGWIPGFAAIRLPYRFLVIAQLGAALLVALGLDQILMRLRDRRLAWCGSAVVAMLALATMPALLPHPLQEVAAGERAGEMYRWLGEHGDGRALLELPLADVATAGRRMVASTAHWLPMIDGYSAYPPLTRSYLRRISTGLPGPAALQQMVDLVDVGWIAVHDRELDPTSRQAWAAPLPPGLEAVARFGDDLLLRVAQPRGIDRRAQLVSTTQTLGGVPLAPLGRDCPGMLRASLLDGSRAVPPGAPVRVGIDVANQGEAPWPGFGLYPRFLVQLRATILRGDDSVASVKTLPLWRDVPANGNVSLGVEIPTPSVAGDYTLELGLVQDAQSLRRCGVASLKLPLRVGAPRASDQPGRGLSS